MNIYRNALPILLALSAFLSLPLTVASEICPVDLDAPALLTVEAASEIALLQAAGSPPAATTAFYPLTIATKEEDHEIDPDPGMAAARGQIRPRKRLLVSA